MFEDHSKQAKHHEGNSFRDRLWRVIFLSDTKSGRAFDIVLLWLIGISVGIVMLESVPAYHDKYARLFLIIEWAFTIIFTIEYAVRIWVVRHKKAYIFSFFGIVDILSIIPTYLTLIFTGSHYLLVIRILRLLRVFRIMKMARHIGEANLLLNAFRSSFPKITVFVFIVFAITVILGTAMYIVEGVVAGNPGFSSVPESVYWGIVTISTVGYGDITPVTVIGKMIATVMMLIGYGIIAVPTGIVTAELNLGLAAVRLDSRRCRECGHNGHDPKAQFCKMCGREL